MTGDGALELRNNEIMPPDRDWSIRTMAEKKAPAHQPTNPSTHQNPALGSAGKKIRRPANWSGGEAGGGDQR
jgi:hypothetical protein